MRAARDSILIMAAFAGTAPASGATLVRAGDGAAVAAEQADANLAQDSLVASLAAGESLAVADQRLHADADSRAMISLSSEFLTIAVTYGRMRLEGGPAASPGGVLLLALDGDRIQRLAFDGARLAATLSPGARTLIGEDLEAVAARQRRGAFWGAWEPLRVNARAPDAPAAEALRATYLSDPAIVRQRRAAAGMAGVAERGRIATDAFLAAYRAGDAPALAALLDPAPFLDRSGAAGVEEGRLRAAAVLLADVRLQPVLAAAPTVSMAPDGGAAMLDGPQGRWRLSLVARDRAMFVSGLEPGQ